MTPRQAEVALVLESVSGVRGVYAIESPRIPLDFAIEIEQSARTLAAAHFALLRVLSHKDCERVTIFTSAVPPGLATRMRPLMLDSSARADARARVPPPAPVVPLDLGPPPKIYDILVVDDDASVIATVSEVFGIAVKMRICTRISEAAAIGEGQRFDAILCGASRAFGLEGLLAALPLEQARRVIVLADRAELADARWRLREEHRILIKPLVPWRLRQRIVGFEPSTLLATTERVIAASRGRRVIPGSIQAPLRTLFVDLDDDTVSEFLAPLGVASGESVRVTDPDEAVDAAFSRAFHLIVCSASNALNPNGFLNTLASEDAAGADRVVVLVPALDAAFVREELDEAGRSATTLLALPLEPSVVRREVLRVHPAVATLGAIGDVADEPARFPRIAHRRVAALVVDDDTTSQILFSSSAAHVDTDVSYAPSTMTAFEHCVSRPIDVLVISAAMRSDGGEPFYRVLWRLKPELKSRTVLIIAADAMPPSAPVSKKPRVLERPVTRDAVARVAAAFRED